MKANDNIPLTPDSVARIIEDELQSLPEDECELCNGDGYVWVMHETDDEDDDDSDGAEWTETCPLCMGKGLR
jgi:hypothetical protein